MKWSKKPLKTPIILKLQVPPPEQVPGTADRPALSLGFRLAGVLHQRHLDFNSGVTASTALNNWLFK